MAVLHLAVLHLVVLHLVVLCYIVKVPVNAYTVLLLIYLPIIKYFICMYMSVCLCDIQDKVILLSYTIIMKLSNVTLHWYPSCISRRTKNHVNWVCCYVIHYVTMSCWYPTRQNLDKTRHYLVHCINLNIKLNNSLTFPYYPRDRTSFIKKGNTTILYENKLTFLIVHLHWQWYIKI